MADGAARCLAVHLSFVPFHARSYLLESQMQRRCLERRQRNVRHVLPAGEGAGGAVRAQDGVDEDVPRQGLPRPKDAGELLRHGPAEEPPRQAHQPPGHRASGGAGADMPGGGERLRQAQCEPSGERACARVQRRGVRCADRGEGGVCAARPGARGDGVRGWQAFGGARQDGGTGMLQIHRAPRAGRGSRPRA